MARAAWCRDEMLADREADEIGLRLESELAEKIGGVRQVCAAGFQRCNADFSSFTCTGLLT